MICEVAMENNFYPFLNLPLPYAYDALEPFIDEKTMHLHHDKHLQTYIDNLNAILKEAPALQKLSLTQLIQNIRRLPTDLQVPIRNMAGGVYNHRFFFQGMINPTEPNPHGKLVEKIIQQFGSLEAFQQAFQAAALSVFGSGYAWLVCDHGELKILTTPNQNNPMEQGLSPILTIDVWEHAYYLKHYNVRAGYIEDWLHIINWAQAEQNYLQCLPLAARLS